MAAATRPPTARGEEALDLKSIALYPSRVRFPTEAVLKLYCLDPRQQHDGGSVDPAVALPPRVVPDSIRISVPKREHEKKCH